MTLYTFYKTDEKVVYGTTANGKVFYFYSGFESANEAKKACIELHKKFHKEKHKNISDSLAEALTEPFFNSGEWSEIE